MNLPMSMEVILTAIDTLTPEAVDAELLKARRRVRVLEAFREAMQMGRPHSPKPAAPRPVMEPAVAADTTPISAEALPEPPVLQESKESQESKADKSESKPDGGARRQAHRERAARYLVTHNGPLAVLKLATACDIPPGSITAVVEHAWFQRDADGQVYISPEGRNRFG
jgi:hypothetical protein